MTTINVDSNRNISLAEIREHQPNARYIVRIDRNFFGLIDTDEELAEYKKTHKGCKVEKNCKRNSVRIGEVVKYKGGSYIVTCITQGSGKLLYNIGKSLFKSKYRGLEEKDFERTGEVQKSGEKHFIKVRG